MIWKFSSNFFIIQRPCSLKVTSYLLWWSFILSKCALISIGQEIVEVKDEALDRLLRVFGMEHPGRKVRHQHPPQYMLDLYNSIADKSGIPRTSHPYKANIVRSFPDKDVGHQQRFYFNISSSIPAHENILEAEFHLYKMKIKDDPKDTIDLASHYFEVRVYQVLHSNSTFTEESNKLLDARKISCYSSGWEVFYIKDAVSKWLENRDQNYGLLVTIRNMLGKPADFRIARFAKRRFHQISKQPILVIFSDDGRLRKDTISESKNLTSNNSDVLKHTYLSKDENLITKNDEKEDSTNDNSELENQDWLLQSSGEPTISRLERAVSEPQKVSKLSECTRHELHVDFEKIGWDTWIISPKYYNAYFCKGECSFPLGQNQLPTNHATVQSIVHELKLYSDLETPCCVPSKLQAINLLYFDEHENVILKQYDDMVAVSCGCH